MLKRNPIYTSLQLDACTTCPWFAFWYLRSSFNLTMSPFLLKLFLLNFNRISVVIKQCKYTQFFPHWIIITKCLFPCIFKLYCVNISTDKISTIFDQTLDQGDKSAHCHWLWITLSQSAHTINKPGICLYTLDFISYNHICYHLPFYIEMHALLITRYKNVILIYDSHSLLYYPW